MVYPAHRVQRHLVPVTACSCDPDSEAVPPIERAVFRAHPKGARARGGVAVVRLRWWLGALIVAPCTPFLFLGLWLMKMLPRKPAEMYSVPIPPSGPPAARPTILH